MSALRARRKREFLALPERNEAGEDLSGAREALNRSCFARDEAVVRHRGERTGSLEQARRQTDWIRCYPGLSRAAARKNNS